MADGTKSGKTRAPRVVSASDFDFSRAKTYRKTATIRADQVKVAKGGEEVTTRQPGKDGSFVETRNKANAGDYIVTRSAGDSYVTAKDKFPKMWEPHPNQPGVYRSTNYGKAVTVRGDVQKAAQEARGVQNVTDWASSAKPSEKKRA